MIVDKMLGESDTGEAVKAAANYTNSAHTS